MKNKLLLAVIAVSSLLTACGHVSNAVLSEQELLDKAEFATGRRIIFFPGLFFPEESVKLGSF